MKKLKLTANMRLINRVFGTNIAIFYNALLVTKQHINMLLFGIFVALMVIIVPQHAYIKQGNRRVYRW